MVGVENAIITTAFENVNAKGNGSQIGYAERVVSHNWERRNGVVLAGRSGTNFASG